MLIALCLLTAVQGFVPHSPRAATFSRVSLRSTPETAAADAPAVYQDPTSLEFRNTKYFFGRVTVGLGPGLKPYNEIFNPSWKDDSSSLGVVEVPFPMGIVFEESEIPNRFEIIEVVDGGNAAAAGVRAGDVLRATTAMAVNRAASMEEADKGFVEADAFGGKPGLQRCLFVADGQTFDALMTALSSNAEQQQGPGLASLVIERRYPFGKDD